MANSRTVTSLSQMDLWKAFLFDFLIPECTKRGYVVEFESAEDVTCVIFANLGREEVPMEQLSFLPEDEQVKAHHPYQD